MAQWEFTPAPPSVLTHLDQADLDLLLSVADEVTLESGVTIWEAGDAVDAS